jgi:hypothetical protein
MSKGQRYLLVVVDHNTGRLVWGGQEPQCRDVEPVL